MPAYNHTVGARHFHFDGLKSLLARATPERPGDQLAGVAAGSAEERAAAQRALADVPQCSVASVATTSWSLANCWTHSWSS